MSSMGVAGEGCILVLVAYFSSRQVLEAAGRKDLPRATAVRGSAAGGENSREIATSARHPAGARSPLALREDRRGHLLGIHPNDFLPSSPCDPGPPGEPRAHLEFPLSDALVPAVDAHCVAFAVRR